MSVHLNVCHAPTPIDTLFGEFSPVSPLGIHTRAQVAMPTDPCGNIITNRYTSFLSLTSCINVNCVQRRLNIQASVHLVLQLLLGGCVWKLRWIFNQFYARNVRFCDLGCSVVSLWSSCLDFDQCPKLSRVEPG